MSNPRRTLTLALVVLAAGAFACLAGQGGTTSQTAPSKAGGPEPPPPPPKVDVDPNNPPPPAIAGGTICPHWSFMQEDDSGRKPALEGRPCKSHGVNRLITGGITKLEAVVDGHPAPAKEVVISVRRGSGTHTVTLRKSRPRPNDPDRINWICDGQVCGPAAPGDPHEVPAEACGQITGIQAKLENGQTKPASRAWYVRR